MLVHVNVDGDTLMPAMAQLSVDPSLICAAALDALPNASSETVTFCVCTTGGRLSITVTTVDPLAALPCMTVTVSVTVLGPALAQVKVDGATLMLKIPQA